MGIRKKYCNQDKQRYGLKKFYFKLEYIIRGYKKWLIYYLFGAETQPLEHKPSISLPMGGTQ